MRGDVMITPGDFGMICGIGTMRDAGGISGMRTIGRDIIGGVAIGGIMMGAGDGARIGGCITGAGATGIGTGRIGGGGGGVRCCCC